MDIYEDVVVATIKLAIYAVDNWWGMEGDVVTHYIFAAALGVDYGKMESFLLRGAADGAMQHRGHKLVLLDAAGGVAAGLELVMLG